MIKSLLTSALLVATGACLLYEANEAAASKRKEEFWREMYRGAERDAQFKLCLDYDESHVICERAK